MAQIIDRTEEKIELAKELGLQAYHREKLNQKEIKKTINDLTGMNFQPTTADKIRKKLSGIYFHGIDINDCDWIIPLVAISGVVALMIGGVLWGTSCHGEAKVLWLLCALTATVPTAISTVRFSRVRDMSLKNWPYEIPYGGLLAVKEAKEKGISEFEIFYPTRAEYTPIRLLTDPIITGMKNDIRVEIFAWDDRKVYE